MIKSLVCDLQPWNQGGVDKVAADIIRTLPDSVQKFYFYLKSLCASNKMTFATYSKFWVFGCPTSTDIDVVVQVNNRSHVAKKVPVNEAMLKKELDVLGYDVVNRELDICIVYLDVDDEKNQQIVLASKGGSETHNCIFYTYDYHEQKYPNPFNSGIEVDLTEKTTVVAKFLVDNLKILISNNDYAELRDLRRVSYTRGQMGRLEFAVGSIGKITKSQNPKWVDLMKSLTMKIVQLILLEKNQYEYTKTGLADAFSKLYPDHQNSISWFLMRGLVGEYSESCLDILKQEFIRIAGEVNLVNEDIDWIDIPIDTIKNPTKLSDELYGELVKSPLEPTEKACIEFQKICPNRRLNGHFQMSCSNVDKLINIQDKVIAVDQRSPEWLTLMEFYTCGINSGLTPYDGLDWVTHFFNLIRGSFVELMVSETCDFSPLFGDVEVIKASVGLLVKEKDVAGSAGCAPDMLLVVGDEIVPVEIKCLTCKPGNNRDYRRAMSLATKQVKSVVDIINDNKLCRRGVIMICHVYNGANGIVYETKARVVSF